MELLLFHADWAPPSHQLKLDLSELDLPVTVVDVVADPAKAREFDVRAVPTLVLLIDGEEVRRKVGYDPEKTISHILKDI